MATPTFIQDSRIGRTIYQIRDGVLQVTTTGFGRITGEHRFDLRTLNPNYQARSVRNYPLIIVPLVTMLICAAFIWGLFKQSYIPEGAMGYFYHWPVLGFFGSLFAMVGGLRRVEYFRFSNHRDSSAVDIIRERQQEAECASFILALVAHIEIAQSDLQKAAKDQLLQNLAPDNAAPRADMGPARWAISILLGILAVVVPLIPALNRSIPEYLFFPVFMLSLGGMGFSVYSFISKEPKKWWSILGFVLSLIPPYFY